MICKFFGHLYYVIQKCSPTTRKVGCKRCPRTWGMNDSVKAFVEWDGDLELLHR